MSDSAGAAGFGLANAGAALPPASPASRATTAMVACFRLNVMACTVRIDGNTPRHLTGAVSRELED